MDIMIPYLGQITRLQLESKGAFHIAGLKDSNAQRIEREKRQKRQLERKELLSKEKLETAKKERNTDEEDETHLDTWA
ncbi:hypothetical protein H5154_14890 [Pseudoalteromonas sp. SR44-5]|uniref:hypothetical protein n=1 Tax=unclassified Pseudoalteromonas TaxID=194690 RepID=UPI001602E1ED|nr:MULTISPECIES: hypothetical protein [unclassified Pseudoalteromonas]MBB1334593.1 hypothetical protein [Pseudoalteromonas sp. SR41-6]MBB1342743.1 hypothetical protein [Pseudoalteromonas sp. SR45-6]MBB1367668.1 hypothetical protein [Pseudoalteromonas sp. SR44-5]MBB1421252.1 hypothetical protein [Pseudoalteromonas sp. SG43-7]MBB1460139.1 hypothetical protein [Pseudoalteromonas sp. SG41-8]